MLSSSQLVETCVQVRGPTFRSLMASPGPSGKRARSSGADASASELSSFIKPLLTDKYQVTMAYAYWCAGRHEEHAVFELFFRKNPFKGEFTLFCGLEEVLRFCHSFKFTEEDIVYLQSIMPTCDPAFFPWLQALDCREVELFAHREGSIVFPR